MATEETKERKETIPVIASEANRTRGRLVATEVDVATLGEGVRRFLHQVESILAQAPDTLGSFYFEQIEVHADVSAKGTLALFGTGGEVGTVGGLKFVFRRARAGGEAGR